MATGASQVFSVTPEFTAQAGVDDQVAIWFGSGPQLQNDGTLLAAATYEGRDWTTLSGSTKNEIQDALDSLIQDTSIGTDTDYATSESVFSTVAGSTAGLQGGSFYVQREVFGGFPFFYMQMRVAMHRRRWLALGFDPEQQDIDEVYDADEQVDIVFEKLSAGDPFIPRVNETPMGTVPGTGYYMGVFTTINLGAQGSAEDIALYGAWDNDGNERRYDPLFPGAEIVRVIRPDGGQVIRIGGDSPGPALLPQSHLPHSGSIDGTDTDASGFFLILVRRPRWWDVPGALH
jgi:hypothetical protein